MPDVYSSEILRCVLTTRWRRQANENFRGPFKNKNARTFVRASTSTMIFIQFANVNLVIRRRYCWPIAGSRSANFGLQILRHAIMLANSLQCLRRELFQLRVVQSRRSIFKFLDV